MNRSKIIHIFLVAVFILLPLSGCDEDGMPVAPVVDHIAPAVEWISPASGAELSGVIELAFNVYDEGGIDSACVYINGSLFGEGGHSFPPLYTDTLFTLTWNTADVEDELYILEARAWDEAGNMGTSPSLLVRVKNNEEPPPEDHSLPVISWLSPQPGDTLQGTVELRFQVMDDVELDSVKVYLNGREWKNYDVSRRFVDCRVTWITTEYYDASYIIEVRAWDMSGNVGSAPTMILHVMNQHARQPQVIWVPDDYATIQDAINASEDGDTIIVRAGEYHEQLQFFDKNVSMVSESGPEETTINGTDFYTCAWVTGGQDTTMLIRGFTFLNHSEFTCYGAVFSGGASPTIVNNIFSSPEFDGRGIILGQNAAIIRNNLFTELGESGIEIAHSWGDVSNNMFLHIGDWAIFNIADNGQLMVPDYNLLWDFSRIWLRAGWGENNIMGSEPIFLEGSYRLQEGSPGIDQGRPDLRDPDSSRSDIGVYGGPYAY